MIVVDSILSSSCSHFGSRTMWLLVLAATGAFSEVQQYIKLPSSRAPLLPLIFFPNKDPRHQDLADAGIAGPRRARELRFSAAPIAMTLAGTANAREERSGCSVAPMPAGLFVFVVGCVAAFNCEGLRVNVGRRSAVAAASALFAAHASSAAESELIEELLRRTEANKERNAAIVRRKTDLNAFTAIDGTVDGTFIVGIDGKSRYLSSQEVFELKKQRRLGCPPSGTCYEKADTSLGEAPPLQLNAVKKLQCDQAGRNCKFK